ncbi:MAG: cation:H+ antiporter [Chlamydiales bacterium]|jgi:cation:H+ antiporter
MSPVLVELVSVAIGFVALIKGASWLVDGGAALARRLGMQPMTIGLTVIAWGTSMPEIVVSGMAAFDGHPDASLGNVLGSNIANIALVLGVTGLILPSVLGTRVRGRDGLWLIGALGILWGFMLDESLTRIEALALVSAFLIYTFALFRTPRVEDVEAESSEHTARRPWVAVLVGTIAIAIGGRLVLYGAEGLALRAGVSQRVIGLTVYAIGTSLPELAASVQSALRGHPAMGVGNVVGSNIFNSLAAMGFAGLIAPFDGRASGEILRALTFDFPTTLGFSLVVILLSLFMRTRGSRLAALALVLGYAGYIGRVFATG